MFESTTNAKCYSNSCCVCYERLVGEAKKKNSPKDFNKFNKSYSFLIISMAMACPYLNLQKLQTNIFLSNQPQLKLAHQKYTINNSMQNCKVAKVCL